MELDSFNKSDTAHLFCQLYAKVHNNMDLFRQHDT